TSSNVNIAAGAAFRNSFVSIFNSGSTVSGAGVFHENNGTLLLNNAIILASSITLNISGGNISGSGSLNIAGPVNWSGGTLSVPATFTNTVTANLTGYEEVLASTLTNNGTINWSGVYLSFNGGVLVNNKNINNIGDGNIYRYSGGVINNNSGATFKKLTATGNTLVSVDINNTGTMDIQSGSFEISSDTFTTNSNVNIAAGATFKNSSVSIFTGGSTITGAGTLHQNNGTLTLNSAISLASSTILNISGGNINGTGSLNIAGLVNWSGGTVSVPTTFASTVTANLTGYEVVIANTLTNNGTINWSGTYLSFNGGTLANNKDINNTSDGIFYRYLGGIINNNSGATFRKLAATGSTFSGVDINNTGTIDIQSGTFDISSDTFTTSSNVNIAAGATFKNTHVSVFNSGSSISGAGTFNHSGLTVTLNTNLTIPANIAFNVFTGTINGTGSLKVNGNMEWDGGSLAIPTTFQSSSVINLNTFEVVVASTITNNGIINWHTAYLSFSSGTLINNRTFNITDDNQMYNYGAGSFTNAVSGVITKTSTGITTIGIPLTNNGTIKGVGTYSFGTGLLNNKGIFAPGSSIGILTTGVDYTNKTLEIEMLNGSGPGTGHDQLAVNGKVKLKDTLKISRTGVVPKGNYTILTATGSVSGVFDTIIAPAGYLVTKVGKTMRVTVPDPGVTIKDTIITEGNAGTKQIRFVVNLAFPSNLTGTVDYQTVDSTATVAGNDYVAKSGTLTFTPGKVADTISINVKGDTLTEADEVFYVKLLNPVNLVIAKEKGIGTIINNDGLALFAGSGFNGDAISAAGKPSASSLIVPNLLHRNQQWTINGLTENNTVTIINSQGISVFRETNYKNNTNLSQLAAGLYYYQILVQDKNGKPAIYKGKLVIL
ncbi:MAG TPA: Calx-beta domain-containing protein, partial [Panacibacter sp.]|nr:Calx-beta domain-containing protein [Panacibacter sp.]